MTRPRFDYMMRALLTGKAIRLKHPVLGPIGQFYLDEEKTMRIFACPCGHSFLLFTASLYLGSRIKCTTCQTNWSSPPEGWDYCHD